MKTRQILPHSPDAGQAGARTIGSEYYLVEERLAANRIKIWVADGSIVVVAEDPQPVGREARDRSL